MVLPAALLAWKPVALTSEPVALTSVVVTKRAWSLRQQCPRHPAP